MDVHLVNQAYDTPYRKVAILSRALRNVVRLPNIEFRSIAGKPITSEIAVLFRADESAPSARNFIQQIVKTPISMLGGEGQPQMSLHATRTQDFEGKA